MEFTIESRSILTLGYKESNNKAKLISTDFNLKVSEQLDENMYLDEEGLPTKIGSHAVSQCFIQGVIGNVHYAHEKGYRDSAEHLRYIISELERAFIQVPTISKTKF